MVEQAKKGGEIDSTWGSGKVPESDMDQPFGRIRERQGTDSLKKVIEEGRETLKKPIEIKSTSTPKPFSTERMKFGPEVTQRKPR